MFLQELLSHFVLVDDDGEFKTYEPRNQATVELRGVREDNAPATIGWISIDQEALLTSQGSNRAVAILCVDVEDAFEFPVNHDFDVFVSHRVIARLQK